MLVTIVKSLLVLCSPLSIQPLFKPPSLLSPSSSLKNTFDSQIEKCSIVYDLFTTTLPASSFFPLLFNSAQRWISFHLRFRKVFSCEKLVINIYCRSLQKMCFILGMEMIFSTSINVAEGKNLRELCHHALLLFRWLDQVDFWWRV